MPIKDLSDTVRLPRLGKIHLGIRHPEKGYPMKTDYFVFPKDHSDLPALIKVFGEQPKELRILIPVEDEGLWASQYYKAYDQTHGLLCKGDGESAMRMIDTKTGDLPKKETVQVALKEMTCAGKDCPDYQNKKCHQVMNLRFILPEVPGLGVWQIDTGSINSILNINSCAKLIKRAFGRISLIPLKLTLEDIQVNNPENGKKQVVYVLNLRTTVTLAQLADAAREQAKTFLLEAPDLEAAFDAQLEQEKDEPWGKEDSPPPIKPEPVLSSSGQVAQHKDATKTANTSELISGVKPEAVPVTTGQAGKSPTAETGGKSQPDRIAELLKRDFKNAGELKNACKDELHMTLKQIADETAMYDLMNPGQRKKAWEVVVGLYGQKEGTE